MKRWIFILVFATAGQAQAPSEAGIRIIDKHDELYERLTTFTPPSAEESGRQVGNILIVHYFPGMRYYEVGRYREANQDLMYLIQRPDYINGNPNQGSYLSNAHYARGMIFLYHAEGARRLLVARNEFENAIKWNPTNYVAYLELSRLFVVAGLNEQAAAVLRQLLDIAPSQDIAREARVELTKLETGDSK
jgi:tetratricopeptide (TPR) repeat protein